LRINGHSRRLEYQAEWQGCDPDDTFYPASFFKNAATALATFHKQYPDAAGPPKRLEDWILAAADDRDAPTHPDDDTAEYGEQNIRRKRKRRHT
jgi:hypothetical protein